jgi:NAD(P)-dependent dehydrogenase (short-subunit alcohol dehydrogenase family)
MDVNDRVIVVTGAGRGIGAALCREAAVRGAAGIVVSDIDLAAAGDVAAGIGDSAIAIPCDVGSESGVQQLVAAALRRFGRIDMFFSNAGITVKGGLETPDADWQRMWNINVLSRVSAARAVVPHFLERGGGCLIHTASAAALLTEIGSATYSVTKHADLALAEWLSVCYGRQGVQMSVVCPLGVQTGMLDDEDPIHRYLYLHVITAEDAARSILDGVRDKRFLILPHPEVADFWRRKFDDYDQWLRGMQRLRQKLTWSKSKSHAE